MKKKLLSKIILFLGCFFVIGFLFLLNINKNKVSAQCVCGQMQSNGTICASMGCTCSNPIPLNQVQCQYCQGQGSPPYDACNPVGSGDGTAYPCCYYAPVQTQCSQSGYFCTSSGYDCSNSGGTLQSGWGCTSPQQCCVHTPTCNTGIQCSTCSNPNNNTCGGNNGIGTNCYYSTYNNTNQFCNYSFTAPNQPNYCNYNGCYNGYSCVNGGCYLNCNIGSCGGGCADPTSRYVTGSSQTCGGWFTGAGCYYFNTCPCTNGAQCGACNPATNTCNTNNGTQSCTYYQTPRGDNYCTPYTFTQQCTQANCSTNYTCSGGNCLTSIIANAYNDTNYNNTKDTGETASSLDTITLSTGASGQTDANGQVTFGNITHNGTGTTNYTVTLSVPTGFAATVPYCNPACSSTNPVATNTTATAVVGLNNTNGNTNVYFGVTPMQISGQISVDYYHNGTLSNYTGGGGTLTVNGVTVIINANGSYTYTPPIIGTYSVSYTPPVGYENWPTNSGTLNYTLSRTNPQITNANFVITPIFSISGRIYNDVNKNGYYSLGVDLPINTGSITVTGPQAVTATINNDGTYNLQNIISGTYKLVYAPPSAAGWTATYPPNLAATVTVGNPCNAGNNHYIDNQATYCDGSYNIVGLDFGITNENAWVQGICGDLRVDTGFSDPIPVTASCGGTSGPYANICPSGSVGIIYTGATDASFSQGSASSTNWLAGGSTYAENFTPVNQTIIRSSYSYVSTTLQQAGITPIDLSQYCSLVNCLLPSNLPSGVYLANSGLVLASNSAGMSYTAPSNTNVTILVNGTTTINGKISIPANSGSAFTLISAGNITIDAYVGETDSTSLLSDLDGFYSTDQSFIVNSAGTCNYDGTPKDKKLNIAGAVVVNAGNQGGSFQNARDLCATDTSCPTTTITQRVDLLLNMADVLKHVNNFFQEVAP